MLYIDPLRSAVFSLYHKRLYFGGKTWHRNHRMFCICRGSKWKTIANGNWDIYNSKSLPATIVLLDQCFYSDLSLHKPKPPPRLDTCSFEMGSVSWQIKQQQKSRPPDHPAVPAANVINDEALGGCRRMAGSNASWHWLIEWGKKNRCRHRPWYGRDDKNIITAATVSKLFKTNYAQQVCTALVSQSQITRLPEGTRGKSLLKNNLCPCDSCRKSLFSAYE